MSANGADDFPVGYGRPPKHTQFSKGKTGNPKGRPKGSKNFTTVIQDELKATVFVTENGTRRKITKREAVAKQLVNRAAAGDPRAIPILLNETRPHENALGASPDPREFSHQEDQMVLASIVRRIQQAQSGPPDPTPSPSSPLENGSDTVETHGKD